MTANEANIALAEAKRLATNKVNVEFEGIDRHELIPAAIGRIIDSAKEHGLYLFDDGFGDVAVFETKRAAFNAELNKHTGNMTGAIMDSAERAAGTAMISLKCAKRFFDLA